VEDDRLLEFPAVVVVHDFQRAKFAVRERK
jgi:hypothetical protein